MRPSWLNIVISVLILAFIMAVIIMVLKIMIWLLPVLFIIAIAAFVWFQFAIRVRQPRQVYRNDQTPEPEERKIRDAPEAEVVKRKGRK
jgi:uncharacterized protein (DUF58 family)